MLHLYNKVKLTIDRAEQHLVEVFPKLFLMHSEENSYFMAMEINYNVNQISRSVLNKQKDLIWLFFMKHIFH
jgi:hypothetical protein